MCVALVIREPARIQARDLKDMQSSNPDGIGIAWTSRTGAVCWEKGITIKRVEKLMRSVPLPALLHFRLATSGSNTKYLCHPFPIQKRPSLALKGRAKSVMVHNGHWFLGDRVAETFSPSGLWSDSRFLARLIAVHGPEVVKESSVGRTAILDSEGKVVLEGTWSKFRGNNLASNLSFLYTGYAGVVYYNKSGVAEDWGIDSVTGRVGRISPILDRRCNDCGWFMCRCDKTEGKPLWSREQQEKEDRAELVDLRKEWAEAELKRKPEQVCYCGDWACPGCEIDHQQYYGG